MGTLTSTETDRLAAYTVGATASTGPFPITFPFADNDDIAVYVNGTKISTYGVTQGSAYGTSGNFITLQTGVTNSTVTVVSEASAKRSTTDSLTLTALNAEIDNIYANLQENQFDKTRSLNAPLTDATTVDMTLPSSTARAGRLLGFNSTTGNPEAGPDIASVSTVTQISADIGTVAGISSDVTSVAGFSSSLPAITVLSTSANITNMATLGASGVVSNIATVAGVSSELAAAGTNATNAAASATAAANSAAAAATALDSFDDRYLGAKSSEPNVDNDGNALVSGALYFNSTSNGMKVYDGGSWINASSAGAVSLLDYEYTATAGQTTFSGSDNNSATLAYAAGNLIVTLNGIVLDNGSDYTATSGTSIVLASGAALNDHLAVVAFKSFTVADTVAASTGGTFAGGVTVSGTITATSAQVNGNIAVTGTVDGRDVAADGTKLDTNIPSSLGSAGQVLTVNPAGNAGSWVEASGGGEQTFTATGAITAGQPVGVNSNGTISTAVVIKSSVNKPTYSGSTLNFSPTSYDTAQNKFLMIGNRSGENVAIVGGVSGGTFSFGTATTINNSDTPVNRQRVVYDSASGKHLIIYEQQSGQRIRARVATISGTSVSFGTDVVTEAGTGGDKYISASSAGDNKVIMIARQEAGYAGNYYVWARIFTISGTSVSFGSLVDVSGATASGNVYSHRYGVCYDSNADRVVVFYVVNGDTTLYAKVGTVSGSSVSFGSAVDTGYDCQSGDLRPVFDPSTNKVVLVFSDSGNSSLTKAIVGTVSGTSISFASDPTEFGANLGNPAAVYNSTNNTIVIGYSNSLEVIKVSGTKVYRDRVFDTSTVGSPQTVYDGNNQSVVATDTQGECISIKTVSPKFAGFAKEDIANGATGKVTVTGGINTSQSGLISGFDYGLPSDSATLVSGSTNKVGVALSATSILVTEGSI